jgi:uncharacterized protein (DUF4415 family)
MTEKSTKTVYFRQDPSNPPTMPEAEMQALRDLKDEDIDFSDIPRLTSSGWRRVSDLVRAENKKQITLRLDADVIEFFRGTGRRYQSRINAALRDYVNAQKKPF